MTDASLTTTTTGTKNMSDGNGSPGHGAASYEQKFAGFIEACRKAKEQGLTTVLVHHPHVLGDTYEELVESLARLADADLALKVASRASS